MPTTKKSNRVFLSKVFNEHCFVETFENIEYLIKNKAPEIHLELLETDYLGFEAISTLWNLLSKRHQTTKLIVTVHASIRNEMLLLLLCADKIKCNPLAWCYFESVPRFEENSESKRYSSAHLFNHKNLCHLVSSYLPLNDVYDMFLPISELKEYLIFDDLDKMLQN